jgi:hypothetical protein
MTMLMIVTYAIYLCLSLTITMYVGHSLHKNGQLFLVETFRGKEALADSVNHLLPVGFYLINVGFVSLALKYGIKPGDTQEAIEFLSTKLGLVILVLGGMHFVNTYAITKPLRLPVQLRLPGRRRLIQTFARG